MPAAAFAFALAAAVLHAGWNVLVGGARDVRAMTTVTLALAVLLFAPVAVATWSVERAALPWIAASAVLELVYFWLLVTAYAQSDVSLVYPISRGGAPVLVLLVSSLVRARFCEVIAASVKLEERGQELFLMGLFSLLDAITGRPMHDVLANLPLADDIKMALLGNRNRLRDVLACVLAYEQAEWETFGLFAAKLRLDEGETARIYLEAVEWATSSYAGANGSR